MTILDACNSSTVLDIDGAEKIFKEMTLSDFQGENDSSLATSALKYIKVMEGGYTLPRNLSSFLIKKATVSSCDYFNRTMYNHLNKAKDIERRHQLKDPTFFRTDPDCFIYGTIGVCGILQEEYRKLFSEREWSALRETIPQRNFANVKETAVVKKCFECNSLNHLCSRCPKLDRDKPGDRPINNNSNTNTTNNNVNPRGARQQPNNINRFGDTFT